MGTRLLLAAVQPLAGGAAPTRLTSYWRLPHRRSSVVTLISSAVGAGVLSFPFALRCTGWAAGLACIAGIASVEAFTLYVLTKVAEQTGASSYSALVSSRGGSEGIGGSVWWASVWWVGGRHGRPPPTTRSLGCCPMPARDAWPRVHPCHFGLDAFLCCHPTAYLINICAAILQLT